MEAGVPGFSNVSFFRFSTFSLPTSLFSAHPSHKALRALNVFQQSRLSPSLSLFSPPRHYFPSLRFFSSLSPFFPHSRLVSSRFLPSAPTVSEIIGELCGNFSMEGRNERRGEEKKGGGKERKERGRISPDFTAVFLFFFPSLRSYFPGTPNAAALSPLFLSTLCREQVFHRLRACLAISL